MNRLTAALVILATCLAVPGLAQREVQGIAQQEKVANKIIERIIGTWSITKVVNVDKKNDKEKLSEKTQPGPRGYRTLTFDRNGRYKTVDSKNYIDSGSYRINENHHRLYLQSDQNVHEAVEFDIRVNDDILTLQTDSAKYGDHLNYVYKLNQPGK